MARRHPPLTAASEAGVQVPAANQHHDADGPQGNHRHRRMTRLEQLAAEAGIPGDDLRDWLLVETTRRQVARTMNTARGGGGGDQSRTTTPREPVHASQIPPRGS